MIGSLGAVQPQMLATVVYATYSRTTIQTSEPPHPPSSSGITYLPSHPLHPHLADQPAPHAQSWHATPSPHPPNYPPKPPKRARGIARAVSSTGSVLSSWIWIAAAVLSCVSSWTIAHGRNDNQNREMYAEYGRECGRKSSESPGYTAIYTQQTQTLDFCGSSNSPHKSNPT
jgi:hypothetical protein